MQTNEGNRILEMHIRNHWGYERDMLVDKGLENSVKVICVIVVRALSASR